MLSSKKTSTVHVYTVHVQEFVSCVVVLCCTALLCWLIHHVLYMYMYMYMLIEVYIKYTLCVQTCR